MKNTYKIAEVRFRLHKEDIERTKPTKMYVDEITKKSKDEIKEIALKKIKEKYPAFSDTIEINSVIID